MTTQTITLPGGLVLAIPSLPNLNLPTSLPNLNLPGGLSNLPTNLPIPPDQLASLVSGLTPALSAVSPQLGLILTIIGILFHVGQAIHTQVAAQPPGTNPSLDAVAQQFWSTVTKAFPLPQLAPSPAALPTVSG